MQNTMVKKSEFSKMRDCSGFLQIGSHIHIPKHCINYRDGNITDTIECRSEDNVTEC